ncbi:SDR family NAD(P)-dependent oxidoreductase [Mesorhizobium sp. ORM16]|uniref:SDR family NAD(P)-dependent oxidoreductase n=1 Tax=Mesorhizobium sp. ORM16 TaxID=3376989 RepID=UPI003857E478
MPAQILDLGAPDRPSFTTGRNIMTKRTFLVTGASKGIGRALSARLAAAGHHVVGIARGDNPADELGVKAIAKWRSSPPRGHWQEAGVRIKYSLVLI